jgi:hypothetical protein
VAEKDLTHMVPTNLDQQLLSENDCIGLSGTETQHQLLASEGPVISSLHFSTPKYKHFLKYMNTEDGMFCYPTAYPLSH